MFQFFCGLLFGFIIFFLFKTILIDTVKDTVDIEGKIAGYTLSILFGSIVGLMIFNH